MCVVIVLTESLNLGDKEQELNEISAFFLLPPAFKNYRNSSKAHAIHTWDVAWADLSAVVRYLSFLRFTWSMGF